VLWKCNLNPNTNDRQILCTFERKILEEFKAEYKIKNAGVLCGIVIFRICTKT